MKLKTQRDNFVNAQNKKKRKDLVSKKRKPRNQTSLGPNDLDPFHDSLTILEFVKTLNKVEYSEEMVKKIKKLNFYSEEPKLMAKYLIFLSKVKQGNKTVFSNNFSTVDYIKFSSKLKGNLKAQIIGDMKLFYFDYLANTRIKIIIG